MFSEKLVRLYQVRYKDPYICPGSEHCRVWKTGKGRYESLEACQSYIDALISIRGCKLEEIEFVVKYCDYLEANNQIINNHINKNPTQIKKAPL